MPTTEAGKRLLERWDDDGIYFSHQLAAAIDAIEAEAREDCEREMLRQRDCDHSECIEKIEELSDQIARQAAADRTLGEAFDGVRAVAAERARIRAAVEGLADSHFVVTDSAYMAGVPVVRLADLAAVLRIIDGESDADD